MNLSAKILYCHIIFLLLIPTAKGQLFVREETSALALAQSLVGSGVIVSNAVVTQSATTTPTGFFYNKGGTQIGIDSGIVITTGRISTNFFSTPPVWGLNGNGTVPAYNLGASESSEALNLPGDADLAQEIGVSPLTLSDAVILEFDFIPLGDTVSFEYVFSSEEYDPNYVCTFNDPFALFISGPGITGKKNLALVPVVNIPVSVKNVNNVTAAGCVANVAWYVDNYTNRIFMHAGHTKVLQAVSKVQPCQQYHLKIVIADAVDDQLDSGVLLKARSLSSNSVKIDNQCPVDAGIPYVAEGCIPGGINIYRNSKQPASQDVQLSFAGTAINGTDVQLIPSTVTIPANDSVVSVPVTPLIDNLPEGIEKLKIYLTTPCSTQLFYLDSITIDIRDYDTLYIIPKDSAGVCRAGSLQLTAAAGFTTYTWNNAGTLSATNIRNPIATPVQDYTVYVCTADLGNCHAQDSVLVKIKKLEQVQGTDVNCSGASTGQILAKVGWEWTAPVQYSINNGPYQNNGLFTGLPVGSYKIKVKDATGCTDSVNTVINLAYPPVNVTGVTGTADCNGSNGTIVLTAADGAAPYTYSVDGINYVPADLFTGISAGSHNMYAKDRNGCVDIKPFTIVSDPPVTFTEIVTPASCSGDADGTISVSATGGNGQYSYSSDGITFQPLNTLNVTSGLKLVTVKDNRGCTMQKNINVPLNNTVTVNAGANVTICEGKSTVLNAVSNGTSFQWLPATALSNPSILNPVAAPVTTTLYTITATTGICNNSSSVTVTVLPAPVPDAGADKTICYGATATLSGNGGVSCKWVPSSFLNKDNIANPTVSHSSPGNITYHLWVIDANGCQSLISDDVVVTTTKPATLFAGNDTIVAINQPVPLLATDVNNIGFVNYTWGPAAGLSNPFIKNPVAIVSAPEILYTVTATTAAGCTGKDEIRIKTYKGPEIYVPTAFTPDNDGKNDLLRAITVGIKELRYFNIYNRFGQLLFSTSDERRGWDGTFKGAGQHTGTYVWMAEAVDYKGNVLQRKGAVVLIR